MEYIYDAPYSDVFRCDGEVDFHDYYYISHSSSMRTRISIASTAPALNSPCPGCWRWSGARRPGAVRFSASCRAGGF